MAYKFCTPARVREMLGGATPVRAGSSTRSVDLSDTALNQSIEHYGNQIASAFEYQLGEDGTNYTLPTSEPDPVTNIWLLLELLNVLPVAAEILQGRTDLTDPILARQGKRQLALALSYIDELKTGKLIDAWLSSPLSTTTFATAQECANNYSSIPLAINTTPTTTTVTRWALRETAYLRVRTIRLGYNQNVATITATATNAYKQLIAARVGAYIMRVQSTAEYGPTLDDRVNEAFDKAERLTNDFLSRKMERLFI